MKQKIIAAALSYDGILVLVALVGALSSFVSLFVDINQSVAVRWLLFVILFFAFWLLILSKVIYDLSMAKEPSQFESPFKYVPDQRTFLIRRNKNFLNPNALVSCYWRPDEVERLAYLGYVRIVQEKLIQIAIIEDFKVLNSIPDTAEKLRSIVVRPGISNEAFIKLNADRSPP